MATGDFIVKELYRYLRFTEFWVTSKQTYADSEIDRRSHGKGTFINMFCSPDFAITSNALR